MTPDQELLKLLRELNTKLGQIDVDFMYLKGNMESLRIAVENLTEAISKK